MSDRSELKYRLRKCPLGIYGAVGGVPTVWCTEKRAYVQCNGNYDDCVLTRNYQQKEQLKYNDRYAWGIWVAGAKKIIGR